MRSSSGSSRRAGRQKREVQKRKGVFCALPRLDAVRLPRMEIGAQILYYTALLVVAIAAGGIIYHTVVKRDLRRDRAAVFELGSTAAGSIAPYVEPLRLPARLRF